MYTLKFTLGVATLTIIGNVHAASTSADVGITATVAANCNLANVIADNIDVSSQIDLNGAVNVPHYDTPLDVTTGNIACNTPPIWTKLQMVSKNNGVMNGAIILPYDINGTFGHDKNGQDITITTFNSGIGPYTDLLHGQGVASTGTPELTILLNHQDSGTALAGNYVDTLTLTVFTSP